MYGRGVSLEVELKPFAHYESRCLFLNWRAVGSIGKEGSRETKKGILTGVYSSAIWIKISISIEELIDIDVFYFFVCFMFLFFSSFVEWLKVLINYLSFERRIGKKGNECLISFCFPSWVAVSILFRWCVFLVL